MKITAKHLRAIEKTIGHDCVASIIADGFYSEARLHVEFTVHGATSYIQQTFPPASVKCPPEVFIEDIARKCFRHIIGTYL